jgi:TPR repeat protein
VTVRVRSTSWAEVSTALLVVDSQSFRLTANPEHLSTIELSFPNGSGPSRSCKTTSLLLALFYGTGALSPRVAVNEEKARQYYELGCPAGTEDVKECTRLAGNCPACRLNANSCFAAL